MSAIGRQNGFDSYGVESARMTEKAGLFAFDTVFWRHKNPPFTIAFAERHLILLIKLLYQQLFLLFVPWRPVYAAIVYRESGLWHGFTHSRMGMNGRDQFIQRCFQSDGKGRLGNQVSSPRSEDMHP